MSIPVVNKIKDAADSLSDLIGGSSETWRDKIQDARFRGNTFLVIDATTTVGRTTVVAELPLSDENQVQDLGRNQRAFGIAGFVWGNNYMAERDALIDAIEEAGPGELMHPTMGTMQVQVLGKVDITESAENGGVAVFGFTFVELGKPEKSGASIVDKAGGLFEDANTLLNDTSKDFADTIDTVTRPVYVADKALKEFKNNIKLAIARVKSAATQAKHRLENLEDTLSTLANPMKTATETQDALGDVKDIESYSQMAENAGDESDAPDDTPIQEIEKSNSDSITRFFNRTYVALACIAATEMKFETSQQAIYYRDLISNQINLEAELAENSEVYNRMTVLRTNLNDYIDNILGTLPRELTIHISGPESTLEIAQRLYQDADRADEIVARNNIQDPGYITDVDINVLSV